MSNYEQSKKKKQLLRWRLITTVNKLQYSLLNVEKPLPTMLKIQIRSLTDAFPSCVEYIR